THAAYISTDPASTPNGDTGFVTKYNSTGSVVYSTYLGGTGLSNPQSIAVDGAGDAYIGGDAGANFIPLVSPIAGTHAADPDNAFLVELKPDGSAPLFATFLATSTAPN